MLYLIVGYHYLLCYFLLVLGISADLQFILNSFQPYHWSLCRLCYLLLMLMHHWTCWIILCWIWYITWYGVFQQFALQICMFVCNWVHTCVYECIVYICMCNSVFGHVECLCRCTWNFYSCTQSLLLLLNFASLPFAFVGKNSWLRFFLRLLCSTSWGSYLPKEYQPNIIPSVSEVAICGNSSYPLLWLWIKS